MSSKDSNSRQPSAVPWTQAGSAAAFVIRYVSPMRRQLVLWLQDEPLADQALALFINHLVSKGYGSHCTGRLRDFLFRGMLSSVKVCLQKTASAGRPVIDLRQLQSDPSGWIEHWAQCLQDHAWRGLEQWQHKNPGQLDFVLMQATLRQPAASLPVLAAHVTAETGQPIDQQALPKQIQAARRRWLNLLAKEVALTLDQPSRESIRDEMQVLKLVVRPC